MRIGFDVSPISSTRTGVGNYCFFLLKHLVSLSPDCTYLGFSSGSAKVDLGPLASSIPHRHLPIPTRALYACWATLGLPKVDRLLGGVDVYHATNFFLPPTQKARRVVSIHDLAFLARPDLCSPAVAQPFAKRIRAFAAGADAILAHSESAKQDIVRFLGVDPAKVTVALLAADEGFHPMPRDAATAHVQKRFGLQTPFLLFVSTIDPRKNVVNLVRAFATLAHGIPHSLVLVGSNGWHAEEVSQTAADLGVGRRVVRLGFAPQPDLQALYSAADAFVFPTRYEGFGLAILEAMTCGCPVITSDNSSVREVAADAALYAPSEDVPAIASAVRRVLEDTALRENLVTAGYEQSRKFSWDQCARTTFAVYQNLAL